MKPYIGITGLTHPEQVRQLELPEFAERDIYLGILVSGTILEDNPKKRKRYPSWTTAQEILEAIAELRRGDVKAAVHYHSKDLESIAYAMGEMSFSAHLIDAIQLNLSSMEKVKAAVEHAPAANIIFQANGSIIKMLDFPRLVAFFEGVRPFEREAHVLFDLSGGRGKPIDMTEAFHAWPKMDRFPKLHFGVAGGLSHENVFVCLKTFGKTVSVDAESGLRTQDDVFDVRKANEYLRAAAHAVTYK